MVEEVKQSDLAETVSAKNLQQVDIESETTHYVGTAKVIVKEGA